jgi:hypothetical protein
MQALDWLDDNYWSIQRGIFEDHEQEILVGLNEFKDARKNEIKLKTLSMKGFFLFFLFF